MNPSEIDITKIKLVDNVIMYDKEPLLIKTEWLPTFYHSDFKTLSVPVRDEKLIHILKQVQMLVNESKPDKELETLKILKEYEKNDILNYSIKPKFTYSKIFDSKQKEGSIKDLQKQQIECRYALAFSKVKIIKSPKGKSKYYGSLLNAKQIQIREREYEDKYKNCIFFQ
jgi:hypothetical protein